MVDVCVRVHGPHTGSMVDCVHPPFPLLVHGGQAQGVATIPLLTLPHPLFCTAVIRQRRAHATAAWQGG